MKGKWSESGVPHKGWQVLWVEDRGIGKSKPCEMCESMNVRYTWHMTHPDHEEELAVGCGCAENMMEKRFDKDIQRQLLKLAGEKRKIIEDKTISY